MLGYHRVAPKYPYEKPQALRDAGYQTLGVGKMHFDHQRELHGYHRTIVDESGRVGSPDFRSDYRGWFHSQAPNLDPDATGIGWNDYPAAEYVLPEELHPTRWTADVAVRFLEDYNEPDPFFLKVSFARPHSPYDPPSRFMRQYEDANIPDRYVGNWTERNVPRSSDRDDIWHGDLGPDQARHSRQGYYANVQFIDEQIGRILETLKQRGLYEDTLIIFFSDHGDMLGDHHMWRKCFAYEPSSRVPMILRWPEGLGGGERGQVLDQPVELRDVFPTFLDAAGITPPMELDGSSLLDLTRGKTEDWRKWIDLEHSTCYSPRNHWNAFSDGEWKYIFHATDGEEQLFHLADDPGEETDLAGVPEYTATLQQWRSRLVDHFEERGEPFLKGGKLVPRPERVILSPHYPDIPSE